MQTYQPAYRYQAHADRWQNIQQRDAIQVLYHAKGQLETTLECIGCFRGALPTLRITDDALLQIKHTVHQVNAAMDTMRHCLRDISFDPRNQWPQPIAPFAAVSSLILGVRRKD
ncbi:uncharacterized protein LOC100898233 [Galendromus occidentalis]|uniref:Uncharacterized protein LOC100898233 n=1 Tax=Galendromus occidentalis TaxID=34638 RepID=A0AAJ6QYS5_9ACAR|nr:uncharacterized protein LOC100898233 [Galendromus occidentalis]